MKILNLLKLLLLLSSSRFLKAKGLKISFWLLQEKYKSKWFVKRLGQSGRRVGTSVKLIYCKAVAILVQMVHRTNRIIRGPGRLPSSNKKILPNYHAADALPPKLPRPWHHTTVIRLINGRTRLLICFIFCFSVNRCTSILRANTQRDSGIGSGRLAALCRWKSRRI